MRKLLLLCLPALLATVALGQDKPDKAARVPPIKVVQITRTEPVAYEKDIEPIFINKCHYCHSGSIKEGKFDLSSYDAMMKGGKRGRPVVSGKSAESLLVKLAGRTDRPPMPPKSEEPLSPEELALIKLWI